MALQQVSVSKTYRTCTAHYLDNYVGKCANLHGHNYVFKVTIHMAGVELNLDAQSMLADFGVLKQFCREFIEPWDHALITPLDPQIVELLLAADAKRPESYLKIWGLRDVTRIIGFGENPTAEAMARFLAGALSDMIEQEAIVLPMLATDQTICNANVEVWETEDSMASWTERVNLTNILETQRQQRERDAAAATILAMVKPTKGEKHE